MTPSIAAPAPAGAPVPAPAAAEAAPPPEAPPTPPGKVAPEWKPFLQEARSGVGRTFDGVLQQQYRFSIEGSGPFRDRQIVADTASAAELLARPHARETIEGLLSVFDARQGEAKLSGISLATSHEGFVANRAVQSFSGEPGETEFLRGLGEAYRHVNGASAVRKGSWIHLGQAKSEPLLAYLQSSQPEVVAEQRRGDLTSSIKTLMHEAHHTVTPRTSAERDHMWLSEGVAETLARWPGAVEQAGQQLGIPVTEHYHRALDAGEGKYESQVATLRGLLRLAGYDPSAPDQFATVERVLQEGRLPDVEHRLATQIQERHGVADRDVIDAALAKVSSTGRDANPAAIDELARVIAASSPHEVPARVAF